MNKHMEMQDELCFFFYIAIEDELLFSDLKVTIITVFFCFFYHKGFLNLNVNLFCLIFFLSQIVLFTEMKFKVEASFA